MKIHRFKQTAPQIELLINNGSERGDYVPFEKALELLGAPHCGVNLMACYYPKNKNWPNRKLFHPEDVPHYRWGLKDETDKTKLPSSEYSTDGYYNLDFEDEKNDVVSQIIDSRKYGHDVTLTLTADCDTSENEIIEIAKIMKEYGVKKFRLNHEANGNTWFRFANQVGDPDKNLDEQCQIYQEISNFFIMAHKIFGKYAPETTLVACYNGPGELINMGKLEAGTFPNLGDNQLGPMYKLPNEIISLDQYGSLHYGWPGHVIHDVPVKGNVTHDEHRSFFIPPEILCEKVFRGFRDFMSTFRNEPDLRINLGELDYDQDIHGPKETAKLILECYRWIEANPEVIGSVVHYILADMGGLGLFQQSEYGNVHEFSSNEVTEVYKDVMKWPVFQPGNSLVEELNSTDSWTLYWKNFDDASGIQIDFEGESYSNINFKENYWKRIIWVLENGEEIYVHSEASKIDIPSNAKLLKLLILPPDGKNNVEDEAGERYQKTVPIPSFS